MINLILSIVARLIYLILSPINFIYVVFIKEKFHWSRLSGYWRHDAVAIDRYGNYNFKGLFNATLIKDNGYRFGDFRETVSSALGKNQRYNTLSKIGVILVSILDSIDENHCIKSINNFDG